MVLGLNKNLKKRKPALSFSALQSFQSCARTRMVAVNTSARCSTKTFNAPALMAISWIRITNLVYPMVRMTQKATMIHTKKKKNLRAMNGKKPTKSQRLQVTKRFGYFRSILSTSSFRDLQMWQSRHHKRQEYFQVWEAERHWQKHYRGQSDRWGGTQQRYHHTEWLAREQQQHRDSSWTPSCRRTSLRWNGWYGPHCQWRALSTGRMSMAGKIYSTNLPFSAEIKKKRKKKSHSTGKKYLSTYLSHCHSNSNLGIQDSPS